MRPEIVIALFASVTSAMLCVALYYALELHRQRTIQRLKDRRVLNAMDELEERANFIGWNRAALLAQECRAIINDGNGEAEK